MLREGECRKVCHIVSRCGGEWSDYYEIPKYVFLDKSVAEDLARKLNERHKLEVAECQRTYDEWRECHESGKGWSDEDYESLPWVPDPEWWVVNAAVFSDFRRA